jgi:predicted TIM-barrel fold metal-dependent hydrolase
MPMLPLVLSSDSHVFEPPDLWQTRIDAAFRDRAPRIERINGADQIVVEADQVLSRIGLISNAGARFEALFYFKVADPLLMSAIFRAYNWLAEFCRTNTARLKGIAMINLDDVRDGINELERVARLGLAGAMITHSSTGATINPSMSRSGPPPRRSKCH